MKSTALVLSLATALITPLAAKDDAPRGYMPLAEFEEVKEKADGKKLVVLLVKGANDSCPNCTEAIANGERAIGSGTVKLFARAESIGSNVPDGLSPALKERIARGFTTGASVTFVVLNPDMTSILAEADRSVLQNDKKATAEFKKKIQDAKKELR
jgi:hypothetical protein